MSVRVKNCIAMLPFTQTPSFQSLMPAWRCGRREDDAQAGLGLMNAFTGSRRATSFPDPDCVYFIAACKALAHATAFSAKHPVCRQAEISWRTTRLPVLHARKGR